VAVLYYSARTLTNIQGWAQLAVWTLVFLVGLGVIAALYAFVAGANRTIVGQAQRLSANLVESRGLADEIRGLHQASEQLRIDAIEANEQLLARVGSDIHDGPLQLLSLAILQLGRFGRRGNTPAPAEMGPIVSLASDAVTELRNISAGLVLPELAGLTLSETLGLAIDHYEAATGTHVRRQIEGLDHPVEPDIQICVFRVVQESLSNAFRHSGGLDQSVTAREVDGEIRLDISNSRSATARQDQGLLRPKLGLRGMRLRVEAVGGGLFVEMGESRVAVRATIPATPRR
jgi:signal transduction histidine kinase